MHSNSEMTGNEYTDVGCMPIMIITCLSFNGIFFFLIDLKSNSKQQYQKKRGGRKIINIGEQVIIINTGEEGIYKVQKYGWKTLQESLNNKMTLFAQLKKYCNTSVHN